LLKSIFKWSCFAVLVIYCFVLSEQSFAQDNWWKDKKYKTDAKRQKFASCKKVFVTIGDGLNYSNVYYIIPYFGSEVYLNILNDEGGYYSPDQTKYIVENFFTNNPVYSFKWRMSSRSENYAFASGKYKYSKNGYINNYNLSVSLKYINEKWLIDQIIIN
jgi:hypothetical protein